MNLIELYGHCEAHYILVDKTFDLNKTNDEMLDTNWDNVVCKQFFTATALLEYCHNNSVKISETYYGKIY